MPRHTKFPGYEGINKKKCKRCGVNKPNHIDFYAPKFTGSRYNCTTCIECQNELAIRRQSEEEKKMEEHDRELLAKHERDIRVAVDREYQERYRSRIDSLHGELNSLRGDMKTQREAMQAKLDEERQENNQHISQISELEEASAALEDENDRLRRENELLQRENTDYELELEEADEIIENLRRQVHELLVENNRLKETVKMMK